MTRAMKDSGVEWIGEIPADWDTIKVKYTSWLKGRIGWQGLTANEYTDEGPYLITGTDFNKGSIDWKTCVHITKERFDEDSDIHVKEGDLLITKDGTVGKVAIVRDCPTEVSLNSGVLLIRNERRYKYFEKYMYYVLLSDEFWRWYTLSQTGQSTIKHLYQAQFYDFEFTFPSYQEQQQIADFLDARCGEIDGVIEKTRETIGEYKKLKQSVITQAVTKGIRPNRPLKPSGIEWIGDIPEDWETHRIKNNFSTIGGSGFKPELQGKDNGDFPVCKASDISNAGAKLYKAANYISSAIANQEHFLIIPKGSILFPKIGEAMKKNNRTVCQVDCCVDNNCQGLVPKRIETQYAFYLLSCIDMIWFDNAGTIPSINNQKLNSFIIPYPEINEQQEIADYLDEKTAEIDALIARKERFISEMESYKKSLIYEYVTGKKEI